MDLLPRAQFLASLPRKRVTTSAFLQDSGGRVLCVDPTYKSTWHLPGGTVEAGESPRDGLLRECHEELTVVPDVGRLLAMGHVLPGADDPDGALAFVYEAVLDDAESVDFTLPPEELRGVAWLDPRQLQSHLSPLAQQLVDAALQGQSTDQVAEFDHPSR